MIRITINTDNAAFDEAPHIEVARILGDLCRRYSLADLVRGKEPDITLRDANGNTVGTAEFIADGDA